MSNQMNDTYYTKHPLSQHLRTLVYVNAVVLATIFTVMFTQMRWLMRSSDYYSWITPTKYFFLGLFVAILGEICAVIWIHRKIRLDIISPHSHSNYIPTSSKLQVPIGRMETPPRNFPSSYKVLNPQGYQGRMDTPPKGHPQSYSALNPNTYRGRMDTPPKGKPQSYSDLNPNTYYGRMDTPSPLKTPAYCPKCGQPFSPFVQKILSQQKTCFCESCGGPLSLHW